MPTTGEWRVLDISKVKVGSNRIRKKLRDIDTLQSSIERFGLFHPIIIDRENVLVAGERRLIACKGLGHKSIPVQFADEVSPGEMRAIELEENAKRDGLTWQEDALAVLDYHNFRSSEDGWTEKATSAIFCQSSSVVNRKLEVARAIIGGNTKVSTCEGIQGAYNIIDRDKKRAQTAEMEKFITAEVAHEEGVDLSFSQDDLRPEHEVPGQEPYTEVADLIVCADFKKWVVEYDGLPFNFIHCDFPYGIGHDTSAQGKSEQYGAYEDSEEIYWELLDVLIENKEKLLGSAGHIMFWFAMKFYERTRQTFQGAGFTVDAYPLIWHKSDNIGIVPDPRRGPRRVYETAFHITKGDRPVVSPIFNTYSIPSGKRQARHLSEKPRDMLDAFFKMYVDSTTSVLDPTCGCGTSIASAHTLGAKRVFGMDIDPTHVETAQNGLSHARLMASHRHSFVKNPDGPGSVCDSCGFTPEKYVEDA